MKSVWAASTLLVLAIAYGDSPELVARVSAATVDVEPSTDTERRIALPDLEFDFSVSMNCGPVLKASRVSISVADTRHSYEIGAAEDRRNLDASFAVPGEQIAPVAADGFCVRDEPRSQRPMQLPGLLSSQISLLCSGESDSEIHFASQALNVELVCGAAYEGPPQASFSTVR